MAGDLNTPTTPASIPEETVSVGSNLPYGLDEFGGDTVNALDALHAGINEIGGPRLDEEGNAYEGEIERINTLLDELVDGVANQVDKPLEKSLSEAGEFRDKAEASQAINKSVEKAEKIGAQVHDQAGVELADSEMSGRPQSELEGEKVEHDIASKGPGGIA